MIFLCLNSRQREQDSHYREQDWPRNGRKYPSDQFDAHIEVTKRDTKRMAKTGKGRMVDNEKKQEQQKIVVSPFTCGACSLINGYRICEISVSLSVILTTSRGEQSPASSVYLPVLPGQRDGGFVASCSSLLHMWTKPRDARAEITRRGSTLTLNRTQLNPLHD